MVVGTSVAMIGVEEHSSSGSLVVKENCNVCNTLAMSLKMERERNSQLENEIKTLMSKMESYEVLLVSLLNNAAEVSKPYHTICNSQFELHKANYLACMFIMRFEKKVASQPYKMH